MKLLTRFIDKVVVSAASKLMNFSLSSSSLPQNKVDYQQINFFFFLKNFSVNSNGSHKKTLKNVRFNGSLFNFKLISFNILCDKKKMNATKSSIRNFDRCWDLNRKNERENIFFFTFIARNRVNANRIL